MYTFDSRIRYSETDSEGFLSMQEMLNYFQDSSTFQSEDLELGISYMKEQKMVWVLSSWQIVVDRYPVLGERVTVGTLPYDFKGFMGYRNFFMRDEAGNYLAKANSIWSLLSTESGKPALPTELMLTKYGVEEKLDMEYAPRKIRVPEGGEGQEPVVVRNHHLDSNQHVNNGQYVSIAAGYLPREFCIAQLRAEYKKQAFLGDVFYPNVTEIQNGYIVSLNDAEGIPYMIGEFLGM